MENKNVTKKDSEKVPELKNYEVVIDLGSKHIGVEATTEEEAKEKAIKEYEEYIKTDPMTEDYWVGDIYTVENKKYCGELNNIQYDDLNRLKRTLDNSIIKEVIEILQN